MHDRTYAESKLHTCTTTHLQNRHDTQHGLPTKAVISNPWTSKKPY